MCLTEGSATDMSKWAVEELSCYIAESTPCLSLAEAEMVMADFKKKNPIKLYRIRPIRQPNEQKAGAK